MGTWMDSGKKSRRDFIKTAGAAALTSVVAPTILHSADKTGKDNLVIGTDEYRYEVLHDWPQLPSKFSWQTTHNVAIDAEGLLYVIHEGKANLTDHPSIFVFDQKGKYVRSFGNQFQGGGHGLEVRTEGKDQFLYVCAYQQVKAFAKLTLTGEVIWEKYAPMDSGIYRKDEDTVRVKRWGRDAFMPTNFAFLNDGGFLLADGYGSFYIHRYDKDGNWVSKFGGPGQGEGKFATPHGIWIDQRPDRQEHVVICDRAHHTLQYLTLDGEYIETLEGYGLPANIDTWKDLMLVPELHARLSILDVENNIVARLGGDVERVTEKEKDIRSNPNKWEKGKFVHPHDACFDTEGNIYVAEWVATGRITKLRHLS
ncbi:TPA: twin-arginine translocation signal domain-containing protein [Candidatus Poribacteria bacterium]|nr:twin-arginine translocation signal domain-containing protein [Candidatus Poribacteria bacterium]HIN30644.1 twin-arginine translocation signal domain-containing protein [Candidatus Poribacteria bacterium]